MDKTKPLGITNIKRDLAFVIDKHNRENWSNTPSHILANYLVGCLEIYESTIARRETHESILIRTIGRGGK